MEFYSNVALYILYISLNLKEKNLYQLNSSYSSIVYIAKKETCNKKFRMNKHNYTLMNFFFVFWTMCNNYKAQKTTQIARKNEVTHKQFKLRWF